MYGLPLSAVLPIVPEIIPVLALIVSPEGKPVALYVKASLSLSVALTGRDQFRDIVAALPVAIYVSDAEGVITYYNEAAAQLWGRRPEPGEARWCGSTCATCRA